ncbi:leucine-rich repeat protein 1, partial [Geospiza fortis]|uniref:Leucine-rich repeat protein 1 n=1 Tax=Geospiza fortis TaxID=48883 RepID=A0A8N5F230_GEOFO
QPCVPLQANVINLKTFLSAVRLAHQGNDTSVLPLSPLVPAKNSDVEKPKTKMIITSRRDYPLTKSFPFSLEHLQTSYCKLARIDSRVLCLRRLRKLDLSLPCRIGQLSRLRFLSAARNKLPFLPWDFRNLSLENLDLFGNPFEQPNPLVPNIQLKIPLTLLECAARATVNHRIPYGCHLLPSHLCKDLEVAKTCRCGSACLSSFIQITVTMNLHHVAHTVVLVDNMGGTDAPVLCYFCSLHCYSQFLDRHHG